jgi:UDP-glucose 4-epimerase
MKTRKKVLITGSKGFIGGALLPELEKIYKVEKVDIIDGRGVDLRVWDKVKKLPSAEIVFHLAALMDIPLAFAEPRRVYETNLMSTLNILEYCRQKKVKKLIFASSYVYGQPEYLPIDEKHPVSAVNPYMHSKLLCEELCRKYSELYDLQCIVFRMFNVYGPGQNAYQLIPTIIRQLSGGTIVLKDPKPKRDFVYISDVAAAYLKAAEYNKTRYEVFNLGSGRSFSVKQVAEEITANYKKEVKIKYLNSRRRAEISDVVADIRKAKKILGWSPKVDFSHGIREVLKSYDAG